MTQHPGTAFLLREPGCAEVPAYPESRGCVLHTCMDTTRCFHRLTLVLYRAGEAADTASASPGGRAYPSTSCFCPLTCRGQVCWVTWTEKSLVSHQPFYTTAVPGSGCPCQLTAPPGQRPSHTADKRERHPIAPQRVQDHCLRWACSRPHLMLTLYSLSPSARAAVTQHWGLEQQKSVSHSSGD